MKLSFSPRAGIDLEEIGDYIARNNPKRALTFLQEIERHCHRIAKMPSAFAFCDEHAPRLQKAVHGNYLIFFSVESDIVRVERIIHGARRLSNLL